MVSQVDHFDTIFVTSEFEALVLENSLIKRHMPRYNILLKDDKGYPLVRLSRGRYPKFTLVNRPANDGARQWMRYVRLCACPPAADSFRGTSARSGPA